MADEEPPAAEAAPDAAGGAGVVQVEGEGAPPAAQNDPLGEAFEDQAEAGAQEDSPGAEAPATEDGTPANEVDDRVDAPAAEAEVHAALDDFEGLTAARERSPSEEAEHAALMVAMAEAADQARSKSTVADPESPVSAKRATSDAMVAAMGVAQAARQRRALLKHCSTYGVEDIAASRIQAGVRGAVDRGQFSDCDDTAAALQVSGLACLPLGPRLLTWSGCW